MDHGNISRNGALSKENDDLQWVWESLWYPIIPYDKPKNIPINPALQPNGSKGSRAPLVKGGTRAIPVFGKKRRREGYPNM